MPAGAFLEAISAPDLGILVNGEDFVAVQDHTEEKRQNVRYQGAYGHDGALIRTVRRADEDTLSFTVVLIKSGITRGKNDPSFLENLRDFEVAIRYGNKTEVHSNCNWSRISRVGNLEQSTWSVDISWPSLVPATT